MRTVQVHLPEEQKTGSPFNAVQLPANCMVQALACFLRLLPACAIQELEGDMAE